MIADASPRAFLVEFYDGKMVVAENEANWHIATNFLLAEAGKNPQGWRRRYDRIHQELTSAASLAAPDALLQSVAQGSTQWSVVYNYSQQTIQAVMGQRYDAVHTFSLDK